MSRAVLGKVGIYRANQLLTTPVVVLAMPDEEVAGHAEEPARDAGRMVVINGKIPARLAALATNCACSALSCKHLLVVGGIQAVLR